MTISVSEPATTCRGPMTAPQSLAEALDRGRHDAIAELADLAASFSHSVALAADRGERLTVEVHFRQLVAVNIGPAKVPHRRSTKLFFCEGLGLGFRARWTKGWRELNRAEPVLPAL